MWWEYKILFQLLSLPLCLGKDSCDGPASPWVWLGYYKINKHPNKQIKAELFKDSSLYFVPWYYSYSDLGQNKDYSLMFD